MNKDKYWLTTPYSKFTDQQWEDLCDRCGLCCFQKMSYGYGKRERYVDTSICCDLYDIANHGCQDYANRKSKVIDCHKLTPQNLPKAVKWLPETCSYRLVSEEKDLPEWHHLKSNDFKSIEKFNICRKFGIKESDVIHWENHILK